MRQCLRLSRRLAALLFVLVSGCADQEVLEAEAPIVLAEAESSELVTRTSAPPQRVLIEQRSITASSKLSPLVEELDRVAVERSVALQDLQAGIANRRAVEFDRYPRVVPTASAPISGGDSSVGINVEQTIWDGGRIRSRLGRADLEIAEARVKTWEERNETIFDGLEAFIDIQKYEARVSAHKSLESDLTQLRSILATRVEGGVADRGEQLRMTLALQEVQRDIVSDTAEKRAAETELARLVSPSRWPSGTGVLSDTKSVCSRNWPAIESPDVARARIRLMQANNSYEEVRARRFPRVVLGAGSDFSSDGFSDPSATLRLDASDMLGFGRGASIAAAEATLAGARRSYDLEKEDTDAEVRKLEQDYIGYQSDIAQLKSLQGTNSENLMLYREQVDAGTIPVAEGISLYQESASTNLDVINAKARALQNCIESARLRGTLAPFGMAYE